MASSKAQNQQPSDLLLPLASHQVIVCASCRYAIQPNAISRHLKEIHHIPIARRRLFIDYIAGFPLKDPRDVIPPTAEEFPVPALPVQQGFKCASKGCSYLCVSLKRMKNHWVSTHDRSTTSELDWRPVPLQTFFRGNLLQYFTHPAYLDEGDYEAGKCKGGQASRVLPRDDLSHNAHSTTISAPHGFPVLDTVDDTLLLHYRTSTYLSFATDEKTQKLWRETVPELSRSHGFLMHGILACSAQHLAFLSHGQREEFTLKAWNHQDRALPLFRLAIKNPDGDNCHAILAFAHLLVLYSFAAEQLDELILQRDDMKAGILPSWLYFLRGICSMLCDVWDAIEAGPLLTLAAVWEVPLRIGNDCHTPLLDNLLSIIPKSTSEDAWPSDIVTIYHHAAERLAESFMHMQVIGQSASVWQVLRIWLLRVSDEFIGLLQNRHPGALILLAHYCILLKTLESNWYFEGQASRLISKIHQHLDPRWHCYIQDPLEKVNDGVQVMVQNASRDASQDS